MAFRFQVSLEIRDASLATKININYERKNQVKISNLKAACELGVISKEELRAKIKTCLHM
jgi:hypothetical protein